MRRTRWWDVDGGPRHRARCARNWRRSNGAGKSMLAHACRLRSGDSIWRWVKSGRLRAGSIARESWHRPSTSAFASEPCGYDSGGFEFGGPDHANARLIGEALRWSGIAALEDADLERSERLLRSALAAIGPEADPHQVLAIELSLARCLFWQGRAREIVLPSVDALSQPIAGLSPHDVSGRGHGLRDVAGDRAAPWPASTERRGPRMASCARRVATRCRV